MSIPKWNWNAPTPLKSVRFVGGPRNTVRGSPKPPRTGCGWSKGLTGQEYEYDACVWVAAVVRAGGCGAGAVAGCAVDTALDGANPAEAEERDLVTQTMPSARRIAANETTVRRATPPNGMCVVVAMPPPSSRAQMSRPR